MNTSKKKSLGIIICSLCFLSLITCTALATEYTITQLTNNGYHDDSAQIHNGQVVWHGFDGHDYEIFLYDGTQIIQFTNNNYWDGNPQIHNGQVVWASYDGHDFEIFLYDGTKTIQLTDNSYYDLGQKIHNGRIVWEGYANRNSEIFFYDGTKTIQLTNNDYSDYVPQIHNGRVVWWGSDGHDFEIFLYDGTKTIQLTDNSYHDLGPQIHNGQVVWQGSDGHDVEIFLYDGTKTIQLTNNDYHEQSPQIHNGQVVWQGSDGYDYEIFFYDGTKTIQLTNNSYHDWSPQIHNGQVVWRGYDGHDWEIFLATPKEAEPIPLGGSKEVTDAAGIKFYRIYIPTRWGGEFTVTTTNGWLELYYPDTSTKIRGPNASITYDIPFERNNEPVDEHGWYYVRCGGASSYIISNTFIQKGEASYRPWNFWYYPLLKDESHPERNLYGVGGALDKYDQVFGTNARTYEEKHYSTTDPAKFWWGHCWGGAVASILLPQPEDTTYHLLNQEEMEGLVSKLANTGLPLDMVEEIVNNIPSIKPALGEDETDEFAGEFHKGLVDYLRIRKEKKRKPLQSNLRDPQGINPKAVWNHAIYKYASIMEEAEEGDKVIIKITTTIYANHDVFPSDDITDRIETYIYKLRYNPDGRVDDGFAKDGQDWIGADGFAPKSLRFIKSSPFDGLLNYNPYVTKEKVEELGVDFP